MNCKDCLFYDFCNDYNEYPEYLRYCEQTMRREFKCSHFKDKSCFVELPCKVGDKIFMIVGDIKEGTAFVDEGTVVSVTYEQYAIWIYARYECCLSYYHKFGCGDYFFTKEEAEKALEERRKEDKNNG